MEFDENDQIEYSANKIIHESAGGFVFFEDPKTHELFVPLLKTITGQYVIPKGHLKKDETPEAAAIREITEELTLDEPVLEVVSFLGVNSYEFTLKDDGVIHQKNVHLYVFQSKEKVLIKPLEEEGFVAADWLLFDTALEKISFDKENLLKARQSFYFDKRIRIYNNLSEITSITIGIPTYNGSKTIENTLSSVIERSVELPSLINLEVIVCTDHCTDNTKELIEKFMHEKNDLNIKITLLNNTGDKGKAIALNTIFENSLGEIFYVVDDDIILENQCIKNLLESLVENSNLRCVFSSWKRLPLKSSNPWKLFWHYVFGVKFDIQPYDKPSEFMRGASLMFRRENYVRLPSVINEDQFLQYIYWPKTKEIENSILHFNSVYSVHDYYKRFVRIAFGSKQLRDFITEERANLCDRALFRNIEYKRIISLPLKQKISFLLYRLVRFFVNSYVKIKINTMKDHEWFRFKQG